MGKIDQVGGDNVAQTDVEAESRCRPVQAKRPARSGSGVVLRFSCQAVIIVCRDPLARPAMYTAAGCWSRGNSSMTIRSFVVMSSVVMPSPRCVLQCVLQSRCACALPPQRSFLLVAQIRLPLCVPESKNPTFLLYLARTGRVQVASYPASRYNTTAK